MAHSPHTRRHRLRWLQGEARRGREGLGLRAEAARQSRRESPVALEAYDTLFRPCRQVQRCRPVEQQVAYQAINVLHECEYCVAGHTYLSRMVKMDEQAIAALRGGTPSPTPVCRPCASSAEAVVRERGFVGDAALDAFLAAGFTRANVLEVVTIAATKTISNYANHITHTPKEAFMADPALGWTARATARHGRLTTTDRGARRPDHPRSTFEDET